MSVAFRENPHASYYRRDGEGCGGGGRSRCEWCRRWRDVAPVRVLIPAAGQWSVRESFSGHRNDPKDDSVRKKRGLRC